MRADPNGIQNDAKEVADAARKAKKAAHTISKLKKAGAKKAAKGKLGAMLLKSKILVVVGTCIAFLLLIILPIILPTAIFPSALTESVEETDNESALVMDTIDNFFSDMNDTAKNFLDATKSFMTGKYDSYEERQKALKYAQEQLESQEIKLSSMEDGENSKFLTISDGLFSAICMRFRNAYINAFSTAAKIAEKVRVEGPSNSWDSKILADKRVIFDASQVNINLGDANKDYRKGSISLNVIRTAEDMTIEKYMLPAFYLVSYQSARDRIDMANGQTADVLKTKVLLDAAKRIADGEYSADGLAVESPAFSIHVSYSEPNISRSTIDHTKTITEKVFSHWKTEKNEDGETVFSKDENGQRIAVYKLVDREVYDYTEVNVTVSVQVKYGATQNPKLIENMQAEFGIPDDEMLAVRANVEALMQIYEEVFAGDGGINGGEGDIIIGPPLVCKMDFGCPIDPGTFRISTRFGQIDSHHSTPHGGIDLAHKNNGPSIYGNPVYAAADGRIIRIGFQNPNNEEEGFGWRIYVDHGVCDEDGHRYVTIYAHMQHELLHGISVNSEVKKGQVIGHVGNTGQSTGPHLHLELHQDGNKVDPAQAIPLL